MEERSISQMMADELARGAHLNELVLRVEYNRAHGNLCYRWWVTLDNKQFRGSCPQGRIAKLDGCMGDILYALNNESYGSPLERSVHSVEDYE